jgi:ribosomal-protein-alanine N-acetyltransferase
MDFAIREMEEKDLEAVTLLEASCFSMPWKYNDFAEILTNPNRFYFVAVTRDDNEKVIGGIMITNIVGEGDISNVAVLEQYRKNNIATSLLKHVLEFGRKHCNITEFTLEVRSRNVAAIRLYENAGFVSAGIRPNFYDLPKDDAIIYWKKERS